MQLYYVILLHIDIIYLYHVNLLCTDIIYLYHAILLRNIIFTLHTGFFNLEQKNAWRQICLQVNILAANMPIVKHTCS